MDRRLGAKVRDPTAIGDLRVDEVAGGQDCLVPDRRYRQVGVHPVAIAPEVVEPAGALILELCRPAILRQPVLAALRATVQGVLAVEPERRRDLQVIEERPVRDHPGLVVRIPEPPLLAHRLKADLAARARGQWCVERIDPVVHVRKLAREASARNLERPHLEFAHRDRTDERLHLNRVWPRHVHFAERRTRAVLDRVGASRDNPRLLGKDVDREGHVRDARLRCGCKFGQRLLMRRQPPFTIKEGLILVEDIGVVVNEAAERRHKYTGDGQGPPGRAGQPSRDPSQAHAERRRDSPAPEGVGEDGKDRRARGPVGMEPRGVARERALAVHVGERYRRG